MVEKCEIGGVAPQESLTKNLFAATLRNLRLTFLIEYSHIPRSMNFGKRPARFPVLLRG